MTPAETRNAGPVAAACRREIDRLVREAEAAGVAVVDNSTADYSAARCVATNAIDALVYHVRMSLSPVEWMARTADGAAERRALAENDGREAESLLFLSRMVVRSADAASRLAAAVAEETARAAADAEVERHRADHEAALVAQVNAAQEAARAAEIRGAPGGETVYALRPCVFAGGHDTASVPICTGSARDCAAAALAWRGPGALRVEATGPSGVCVVVDELAWKADLGVIGRTDLGWGYVGNADPERDAWARALGTVVQTVDPRRVSAGFVMDVCEAARGALPGEGG